MTRSRLDELIRTDENRTVSDRQILEEIQLRRLNDLLARESRRNGFYQLPSELASLEELSSLPFTTADDLRNHCPQLFLGSLSEVEKVTTERTSGTTGAAKRIYYTKEDLEHTVAFFAAGIGEMASAGETVMIRMPYSGPDSLADLIARGIRGCEAVPLQLRLGSLFEQCRQYREEKPACAIDQPVPLLAKARYYEYLYGSGSFPLRAALLSADSCSAAVEKALKEEFGLVLFPHYGTREMCFGGAITCQAHQGMHLREHQLIAEITDESGRPVPDGEWGELVITTVDMKVLPLIRFRTGDRARFLKGPCPCGSVTKRLDRVRRIGKDAEILELLENRFFGLRQVLDLMVREESGKYDLELLILPGGDEAELKRKTDSLDTLPAVTACIRTADRNSTLLYPGKRVILHPEGKR
ncbi:MAG: AMP-binding protein [Solobacterium sp.]|nr:AMP-binding protein [Solobacterium sp.]